MWKEWPHHLTSQAKGGQLGNAKHLDLCPKRVPAKQIVSEPALSNHAKPMMLAHRSWPIPMRHQEDAFSQADYHSTRQSCCADFLKLCRMNAKVKP